MIKKRYNKVFYFDGGEQIQNIKYYTKYLVLFFMDFVWKTVLLICRPEHTDRKYKLSLCTVFRYGAPYLREWIEYHLSVGVEHFYLYNNFSDDNYLEVLMPYIEKGIVTLTDWPVKPAQKPAYRHFFNNYKGETDWVSFLDIDEFLLPLKTDSILDWLEKFQKYPVVMFYWKMFCSGGLMHHDFSKTCMEQYVSCFPKLHDIGKIFFNTDYPTPPEGKVFNCIHSQETRMLGINIPPVNQFGFFVKYGTHRYGSGEIDFQCNHYWSKALDIFETKAYRTSACTGEKRDLWDVYYEYESECTSTDFSIQRFLPSVRGRI